MKKTYPTYEEAQKILQENGISSKEKYYASYKTLGLPSNPKSLYGEEWCDWYTFLGKTKTEYPTYEETQRILQKNGINSMREYKSSYRILRLPSAPDIYYQGKGWIDSPSFFSRTKVSYPSYEEAQRIAIEHSIYSSTEYLSSYKELGLPSEPFNTYKNKGWTSWSEFLGHRTQKPFPTYEEAQRILQENGIKRRVDYNSSFKRLGLPSAPELFYKNKGWVSFNAFLMREEYPTYEEAQRIVIEQGIKGYEDYMLSYNELKLPSNPHIYYKNNGWTDWYDFLGKSKMITQEDRKYNLFKKFAINPALLKDAPLKVLYIYFSKFRGITDGITSLLATSSYEERLNWVKEQLNSLKDGSLSKDKSSEEPDELSAMKSVLEENDDVKKALSGEDAERFNILLENYVHSVVNRELISEVDDK